MANAIPGGGGAVRQLTIDGRPPVTGERPPNVSVVTIGSRYFDTLGLRVVRGRPFTLTDGTTGQESAIVNGRFAATYFPNGDPVGHRIRLTRLDGREPSWLTIVGVSPTVPQRDLEQPEPVVYVPHWTEPASSVTLIVRVETELGTIAPLFREVVRALDGDLPLFDIQMMDEWLAFLRWPQRLFGTMFTIFACVALALSAVGLYAITAYSVTQRTQEIGVRMALGAQARQVNWLVLRRAIAHLGIGLTLGLPGAIAVGRLLPFASRDPITLASVVAVLVLVSLVACVWPARRATRLDPVQALRHE